jgi:hypothetical protein
MVLSMFVRCLVRGTTGGPCNVAEAYAATSLLAADSAYGPPLQIKEEQIISRPGLAGTTMSCG